MKKRFVGAMLLMMILVALWWTPGMAMQELHATGIGNTFHTVSVVEGRSLGALLFGQDTVWISVDRDRFVPWTMAGLQWTSQGGLVTVPCPAGACFVLDVVQGSPWLVTASDDAPASNPGGSVVPTGGPATPFSPTSTPVANPTGGSVANPTGTPGLPVNDDPPAGTGPGNLDPFMDLLNDPAPENLTNDDVMDAVNDFLESVGQDPIGLDDIGGSGFMARTFGAADSFLHFVGQLLYAQGTPVAHLGALRQVEGSLAASFLVEPEILSQAGISPPPTPVVWGYVTGDPPARSLLVPVEALPAALVD